MGPVKIVRGAMRLVDQLVVVDAEFDVDVRMIEHVFEQACKAVGRHRLVGVKEIAVVG